MRPVHRADNLTTFMCRLSWNLGASDLLEPSGPLQACNGTAFYICNFLEFLIENTTNDLEGTEQYDTLLKYGYEIKHRHYIIK